MASKAIRGITVEIGGDTTKLGQALADSEKKSRSLQTELRQVEKLLQFDPTNTELLAQKQEILTSAISETATTLETLESAQAQVLEQFENGEIGEDQYRAFQREILTTKNKLADLETELNSMDTALGEVGTESDNSASALRDLTDKISDQESELSQLKDEYTNVVLEQGKNSDEAKTLASEMSDLNTELKDNKDRLSKAKTEADKLSTALDDAGDSASNADGGFSVMKGALADLTANAIQSAISAIGDFIGALFELAEATEEYRSMQAKLGGAADTFGYSVDFAEGKYREFYSYLGDDQMATNAITNLMGLGVSTESLTSLADGAIAVWASYGDSIPIEALTEAMNETVQTGKVTGAMADTINWTAVSAETMSAVFGDNTKAQKAYTNALKNGESAEDAFNAALAATTDESERAEIVATYLNTVYGDSKVAYDEMTESMRDANEAELNLKDAQAQLGETIEPVNTALTNLKAKALEAILPLVQKLADGFMNLLAWLEKNPTAMKIITAVVIALAAAFGVLATALGIQALITGVTKAIAFLNTTLLANPIVLIIAAIAALVAAFIYLWNNCEGFRQFFINLWETIKTAATPVIEALVTFFTVTVPEAWNSFIAWLPGFIDGIVNWFSQLPGRIWAWLLDIIGKIAAWGSGIWTTATTWVSQLVSSVVNWFAQLPGRIWTWLSGVITRVASWGSNMWSRAKSIASEFVNQVVNFVRQLPGKIWTWLSNVISRVATWGSNMASRARQTATSFVNSTVNFIKGLPGKVKTWLDGVIDNVKSWGSSLATRGALAASNMVLTIVAKAKELPGKIKTVGKNLVEGLWNGIKDMGTWIGEKIRGFGDSVLTSLKNFFGIASPSKVMRDQVGKFIAEGIGVGIEENADKPLDAMQELSDEMAEQEFGFNDATINRKLSTTFSADTTAANNHTANLLAKLDSIYNRLDRLQIVLDTGTLVGETIDKIDAGLADKQLLSARGV